MSHTLPLLELSISRQPLLWVELNVYQYAEVIIQDTIGEHLLEVCKAARTEVIAEETGRNLILYWRKIVVY